MGVLYRSCSSLAHQEVHATAEPRSALNSAGDPVFSERLNTAAPANHRMTIKRRLLTLPLLLAMCWLTGASLDDKILMGEDSHRYAWSSG